MQSAQSKCLSCRNTQTHQRSTADESIPNYSENSQNNVIYIKCSHCQIVQCKPCFKQHFAFEHIQQGIKNDLQNPLECEIICQECQENDSKKFCQNCEQHLCEKCSFRIHNKGKRAKHNLLSNNILIRIQKLFFLNHSQNQKEFNSHSDFDSSNCLVVYGPNRPEFIEDFQSLQVEDMNKLTLQQIQSCLNRYPLISLFSVSQSDQHLTQLLSDLIVTSQYQQEQEQCAEIFLCGFKILLEVRTNFITKGNSDNSALVEDEQYDKVDQNNSDNDSITTLLKTNTEASGPQEKKFRKKDSIDFSSGSQQEKEPIPEMHKLFKKSLKMSNRSLIIQIPQTKQYKQSPIKSDRQQGFIERNMNLLQNAAKQERSNKTITVHLDQDYNDISESTMNLLEQSEEKSNKEESILMMGTMQDFDRDASFRLVGNDQSCSDMGNSIDDNYNNGANFSLLNVGSISLSTENSIRKISKKLPIPYFQPLRAKNIENLNNSYGYMSTQKMRYKLERKFRELAQRGTLMVSRKQLDEFNLKFDEKIIRKMKKNVCDQQIEYYSLNLQLLSIQSIFWVLQSIKEDRMMPSQKLVLSRLKESFNIKPANKLWICIIKYLQSSQYYSDKKEYDKYKLLPTILLGHLNDQNLLEYEEKWPYQDQQEPKLALEEWETFKIFLAEYFKKNKQIAGGRYGCVQYVKLNGPQKLKHCSLGRLSYFVQEAINKGLIRYHKTLLIQNYESFQKSVNLQNNNMELFQLQKQLKILKIQVTLIDIFLQAGPQTEVSLAQIPLTFKKMILFDVNLLELGFPKLKNMLHTLTDKLVLSSSKSHIKYQQIRNHKKIQQLRMKLQQMMQYFISQISEMVSGCMSNGHNMIAQELYNMINQNIGFIFDYRVCDVPDFFQFLIYYCHQIINLQFINGIFVAFPKHMGYMTYQYSNTQNMHHQNCQFNNTRPQYYPNTQAHFANSPNTNQYTSNYSHPENKQFNQPNPTHSFAPNFPQNTYMMNTQAPNYQNAYQFQCPPTIYNPVLPKNSQKQHHNQRLPETQHSYYPQPTQISTPKFNQSIQYINQKKNQCNIKNIQNLKWDSYLDVNSNFQDNQEKNNNFQTESFTDYQSIYNILDDDNSQAKSKLSLPKTFIEKQGSCNHNQDELHISKITPIHEKSDRDEDCDASLGLFDDSPEQDNKINILDENLKNGRKQKGQHTRVYSTAQARTKHQRMYSTTTAKN